MTLHGRRAFSRELRVQNTMRRRVAEATQRRGPSLPHRVPVTVEQLLEIYHQLQSCVLPQSKQDWN